jgi:rhodanese-related sulfurtransferase
VRGLSPADLDASIRGGRALVILDVRSPEEFAAGHVPGAINVPFWRFLVSAGPLRDTADPIVIYCAHGPRAHIAAAALRLRGGGTLLELEGHWSAWRRAALPVESQPAPVPPRHL